MSARALSLFLCALALGCGGSSGSRSATTSAASSSGSTTATTTSSTTTTTTTTTTPLPANFQLVGFETIDRGDMSPRGTALGAHETHVASDVDWASFWPTHSSAALPQVDFQTHSVVGTFQGQKPSGGYATQIVNVLRDTNHDDLRVLLRAFAPGDWRPNTSVITTPFHLVRCATAVSGQGAVSVERQALLDFEPLAAGSDNQLGVGNPNYTGGLQVVRDGAAYNALFAQIRPSQRPPAVDFTRNMVVAVLGAYVPTFGNTLQTLRLIHDVKTDVIRVIWRVNPYRGGAAPPPAVETPFQLLRVTLSTGTIRAEQSTPVTQTPLARGVSNVYRGAAAQSLVIRDVATLASVWQSHIGGAPPVVDFATDQVILAIQPAGNGLFVSVARSALLEDDELAVTLNTARFGAVPQGATYSVVTTPRSFGPVTFETIDTTPRP